MHMKPQMRSDDGIAMIIALLAVVVVAGIGLLMFTRTLNEVRHSGDDARIVQTLMLARGGANVAAGVMITDAKGLLYDAISVTSSPGRWTYGKDRSGVVSMAPDPATVATDLRGVSTRLQRGIDDLLCGVNPFGADFEADVSVTVYFTSQACQNTLSLPPDVTLPEGRYVSGPARVAGDDIGIQEYALPYILVAEAQMGDYRRNIVTQGEYRFTVGEAAFSHYAYFTNRESADGGRIYFTNNTMIDGPTHTNGHFSIHRNPWFGGAVTTAGCKHYSDRGTYERQCVNNPSSRRAGVYVNSGSNGTFVREGAMNPSPSAPEYGNHAPEFSAGVDWQAQYVPLPENSQNQLRVALGQDAHGNRRDDQGVYFPHALDSLTFTVGDVNGVEPTLVDGVWTPRSTHQYITGYRKVADEYEEEYNCRWEWERDRWGNRFRVRVCDYRTVPAEFETIEYRFNEDYRLERLNEDGDWEDYPLGDPRPFNGVVYTNGNVERLRGPARTTPNLDDGTVTAPAIASFAKMTLVSPNDIRITSDIRYETPPCKSQPMRSDGVVVAAKCNNLSAANVFGIFSSGGDIKVGHFNDDASLNAPDDVHVHAVLMSGQKQIRVENYNRGVRRGAFNLLGGMIQENRGIFGLIDTSGFDRVYTYDPRMRQGITPPFFPTTGLGALNEVRYFSFGQREQIY